MQKNSNISFNLILIIVFIITGGTLTFGFAWYNVSVPFPFFRLTDSFVLIIYLLFISVITKRNNISFGKTPIKYLLYFISLFFLIAFKNFLFKEAPIPEIIDKVKYFYILFFIFPLIYLINNKHQLNILLNAIIIIGFISAIVYIYQAITGVILEASSGAYYSGIFRVNHPGIGVMSIALLYIISNIIVNGVNAKGLFTNISGIIMLAVVLLTISRGYILAMFSSIFLMYFFNIIKNKSYDSLFKLIGIALGIASILFVLFVLVNFDSKILYNRISEGVDDIINETGSYNTRTDMMEEKFTYVAENAPILGIGFTYYLPEDEKEAQSDLYYNNPIALNADSTYQNIALVTGFLGLLLWLLNLYNLFKKGKYLFMNCLDKDLQPLLLTLVSLPIFIFLHGFSSNYFGAIGLIVVVLNAGLLYKLFQFSINSEK